MAYENHKRQGTCDFARYIRCNAYEAEWFIDSQSPIYTEDWHHYVKRGHESHDSLGPVFQMQLTI